MIFGGKCYKKNTKNWSFFEIFGKIFVNINNFTKRWKLYTINILCVETNFIKDLDNFDDVVDNFGIALTHIYMNSQMIHVNEVVLQHSETLTSKQNLKFRENLKLYSYFSHNAPKITLFFVAFFGENFHRFPNIISPL